MFCLCFVSVSLSLYVVFSPPVLSSSFLLFSICFCTFLLYLIFLYDFPFPLICLNTPHMLKCALLSFLRHRNWSCSVAFPKIWTTECYSLRKPFCPWPFMYPLMEYSGVCTVTCGGPCVLLLFTQNNPNLPNQSTYFRYPYISPYHSEISRWLAGKSGNHTPITIFGLECFRLQGLNATMVSIIAELHNKWMMMMIIIDFSILYLKLITD